MSTVNEARQKKHTKPKDVLSFRKLNMQHQPLPKAITNGLMFKEQEGM